MCLNDIMPKKTRRQKIKAKNRRPDLGLRILSNEKEVKSVDSRVSPVSEKVKISTLQKPEVEKRLFSQNQSDVKNFKAELAKSLFITVILIVIQLALYYADKNHYLDLASIVRY